jgi:hypothetical protein
MARDFWANAFSGWQLPSFADFTDILEEHPKSPRFLERHWRRRDDAPAAGISSSGISTSPRPSLFDGDVPVSW